MTLSHLVHLAEADTRPLLGIILTRRDMPVVLGRHLNIPSELSLLAMYLYLCVCACACVVLQGAAAVSLRGQPTLLWNVHPDGHHHEQHRSGSRGPRAGQRTSQQREPDWHLDFINKHLEVHNTHAGCQAHSHTDQRLHENVHAHTSAWGFTHKSVSFGLTGSFIRTDLGGPS